MSIEQFYTREKANSGAKLPLVLPTGEVTKDWLLIRGMDSDAFRAAKVEVERDSVDVRAMDEGAEKREALRKLQIRLLASSVAGWSFEKECTQEAVEELFYNAPQIMDAVDYIISRRAVFFTLSSANLNDTPSNNSGSTKSRKGQPARRGKV